MPLVLHWHTEPLLLLTVIFPGWLYAMLAGPWRARVAPGEAFALWPAVRFYAGLATAYLAVGSPLDSIGETFLFSVHMVQHMLLIYVAPPLIISGLPAWMTDNFLQTRPRLVSVLRRLVSPVTGGVAFTLIFSIWHFPELYQWALHNRTVHIVEHWMMFLPAMMMVWPVVSRSRILPKLGDGGLMVYGFVLMIGDLALWAALIFGEEPIYRTYEYAPRITYMSPIQDQLAGAIVMKIFNEGFSLITMGCAFFHWAKKES